MKNSIALYGRWTGLALCALLLAVSGCAAPRMAVGPDMTDPAASDAVIAADLTHFPQDLSVYAERAGDMPLLDTVRQTEEDARFNRRFFTPWNRKSPVRGPEEVFEALGAMNPASGYAENLRPIDPTRWQAIAANANREGYAGKGGGYVPGITVKTAHLRRLPTAMPFFLYPRRAGEGFPFDYLQNSVLWVGTPVGITHRSKDGAWVYVETSLVCGWLPVDDVAAVSEAFMAYWQGAPLAVVIRDTVVLADRSAGRDAVSGVPLPAVAHIGTVLPLDPEMGGRANPVVLFPARDASGNALVRRASLSPEDAAPKPLPLTPRVIAAVGNGMMGQPYGWGGMFGNRDCSSAMHDLFAPFGIWLPRNSQAQGALGTQLTVTGLSSEEKEARILAEGVPFFSLVRMRGHVGLYLGGYPHNGKTVPVMFHNIWGVRVLDPEKTGPDGQPLSGRAVIGKAVVTSLRPGAEHPNIASPASLLDRIDGLAVLPESGPKSGPESRPQPASGERGR